MSEELVKSSDEFYKLSEQMAKDYFKILNTQYIEKNYLPIIIKDLKSWRPVKGGSLFSFNNKKPSQSTYYTYIKWLDYIGKLEYYLDRSISYIFMRDLGKDLYLSDTQKRVNKSVEKLRNYLLSSEDNKNEAVNIVSMYRMAQGEGIESTMIWLIEKIKDISLNIPKEMDSASAVRKLIKIIGGVVMHQMEEIDEELSTDSRRKKLDEAIRLGYFYGLTYPFIDDILDAKILPQEEEKYYCNLIRSTLITGDVKELDELTGDNRDLIKYIHTQLKEAFEYIKAYQKPEKVRSFLNQAYVFFNSQEVDRKKNLLNESYTNEELYTPLILKSSSSRLITRLIIDAPDNDEFSNRIFYYGIYNQLADDFTDMFDDLNNGVVTPYTYYIKYHNKRSDLINPFELYWIVIFNLIHNVYKSHEKTCEIILARAINGLKRYKEKIGAKRYKEIMDILKPSDSKLDDFIQRAVKKSNDIGFFDKLLRDNMVTTLKNENKEQEEFLDVIESLREDINNVLMISKSDSIGLDKDSIVDAANYSLEGSGKRLRPIITWFIGVKEYGLDKSKITPLLKSLEYMHTASLIFDDLPSQDNASVRRGRLTLHEVYNASTAELTGIFLTQRAIKEQASLSGFDPEKVLKLIQYSSEITEDICIGQAMDLNSKGKVLTLEELNTMCFYKTGKAFEASLIMPAILASASDIEVKGLKKFAYHAGIAFQIKDDLLDVEGDETLLGKSTGKDEENKNSTFVTVLGKENAKRQMWDHYCLAIETLSSISQKTNFLKHLLDYIINRDY